MNFSRLKVILYLPYTIMRAWQVEGKVKQKYDSLYAFQASVMQIFLFFILFESFLSDLKFFLCLPGNIRKNEFTQEREKPSCTLLF